MSATKAFTGAVVGFMVGYGLMCLKGHMSGGMFCVVAAVVVVTTLRVAADVFGK